MKFSVERCEMMHKAKTNKNNNKNAKSRDSNNLEVMRVPSKKCHKKAKEK